MFRSALNFVGTSKKSSPSEYSGTTDKVAGSKDLPECNIMDQHQNAGEAIESGKDNLLSTAGNLREAAGAKVEDLRQAAGQKADELRVAAAGQG
jgi:hypothetical protein